MPGQTFSPLEAAVLGSLAPLALAIASKSPAAPNSQARRTASPRVTGTEQAPPAPSRRMPATVQEEGQDLSRFAFNTDVVASPSNAGTSSELRWQPSLGEPKAAPSFFRPETAGAPASTGGGFGSSAMSGDPLSAGPISLPPTSLAPISADYAQDEQQADFGFSTPNGFTVGTPKAARPTPEIFLPGSLDSDNSPAPDAPMLKPTPTTPAAMVEGSDILVVGPDRFHTPLVKVYDAATRDLKFTIMAYSSIYLGGVRVAVGDVNNDGYDDIITGTGNALSHVKVFSGQDGSQLRSFQAFLPSLSDGVFVAAGDVNGDGYADIIAGTGQGNLPRVKVFSGQTGALLRDFLPQDLTPGGGARVAAGDLNLDGYADLIVGSGSGPAGNSRIVVHDGYNNAELFDFFAFDDDYTGGVNLAVGDLDDDGRADIIAGSGSAGPGWVRAYSGANLQNLSATLPYSTDFAGGVRVASYDADGDGRDDLVTAAGPGGEELRILSGWDFSEIDALTPYGTILHRGMFVGASRSDAFSMSSLDSCTVTLTIEAINPDNYEGSSISSNFRVTRSGDTSGTTSFTVTFSGTATLGTDTSPIFGFATSFLPGATTYNFSALGIVDDSLFEGVETVVATLQTSVNYCIDVGVAVVAVVDNDGPLPSPGDQCVPTDLVATPVGNTGNIGVGTFPIRYHDGALVQVDTDFAAGGFGRGWGVSRYWTNSFGYNPVSFEGEGVTDIFVPYAVKDSAGTVALLTGAGVSHIFDDVSGTLTPRYFRTETLTYNSGNDTYTMKDATGGVYVFHGFGGGLSAAQKGQFQSYTDPYGNLIEVTSRNGDGKPTEIQRTTTLGGTTITESLLFTYNTSGTANGLISNVTLRRQSGGGGWSTVRQVDYTYYDGTESYGNEDDLKTAIVKDGSGNMLDTMYYRYYTSGETDGYQRGLKYVLRGESFARLDEAYANPYTVTNGQIAPYADLFLKYDAVRRVSEAVVQGVGCSACFGGQGTFTFSYETSPYANGYNNWLRKTTVGLPDGNERVIYTNYVGETLLDVMRDTTTTDEWLTYSRYDAAGRLILTANPSAVSGYDEATADLLDNQSGDYTYLRNSAGLITTYSYYTSTTAGSSSAGGVNGYFNEMHVQKGESGTAILQAKYDYFSRTVSSFTIYVLASNSVYRETNGTGQQKTEFAYTWFSSTFRPESITVTRPIVTTAQNGPNSADVEVIYFDQFARPIWRKDADGYLHFTEYDQATGAVKKSIIDVDSAQTSDFSNKPSGWSTPGGGGLHLKTTMTIDALGRATKVTDPVGNVTYLVYRDPEHEIRTYAGWNTSTNRPTGPTVVQRFDRPGSYVETLTMIATPSLDGSNLPTGTESIASLQTLSRQYVSAGGQVTRQDAYHNLSGVTYSASQFIGSVNTNYYTTTIDYSKRGLVNRTVTPTGTITRTEYDVLNRPISVWVGTNDTPASGFWSPSNNTSPSNMVKNAEYEYDGGAVGDSNLTEFTLIPGGGAANRVSQFWFDWRNRQVASKQAVEGSESTSLNRQLFYTEFDNLGQAIVQEQYDGDAVTQADGNSDGVPDKPSSSLLRAKTVTSYDERGRVFRTQVYSVNQSSGSVSSDALTTNVWFSRRGLIYKASQPGGFVTKNAFDGAGRTTKSYASDGASDSGYSDADDVTGDKVLEQVEYSYDANGAVLLTTFRQRFHDETGTGELGTVGSGNRARVSYVAMYYDKANRLTDTVNVGTNAASSYTRPGSVPSRSDTVLVTSNTYNDAGWVSVVTDPRGIELRTTYDALSRRTKTIEAYVDGTSSNTDDKTTEYSYDGSNHLLTLKAWLVGSDYQETKWVYGVTTSGGSGITSNDALAEMWYPNKSTGAASSSEKEVYTVNALGDSLTKTDRNGNVNTFSYDAAGRTTVDAVTTLGSGVDGAVRRLETAYDTAGRAYLFTSYDATSSGNVVNQVQRGYNGLGQLTVEYQAHSGAVNTGSTPNVQYAYTEMASSANHSRLVSMTYPNGRVIDYTYGSGLDTSISRLSSIKDGANTLESYSYLGLATVIRRAQDQAGVELTYLKQGAESDGEAGDKYAGIDRFGRIIDQRWMKSSDSSNLDRFQYGYDRDGNRLFEKNLIDATFSELYHANGASNGYDLLNQLSQFRRGTLSDANSDGVLDTVTTASRSQVWTYDPLGNWSTVNDGTAQNRTHNRQNQITAITSLTTPTYDSNGNMTGDENGKTLKYDAWNRLVDYKNGGTSLESYAYDALGRRVSENPGTARAVFYTAEWQVIEERTSGVARVSFVWSPVYIDALIVRDRDSDTNGSLDERLFVAHDANWNVSAILNTSAAVQERFVYDPFGTPSFKDASYGARGSSSFAWRVLRQGSRRSDTSALLHFRNRELSASLGRWNRNDPIGYAARPRNLYEALDNSPVGTLDPLGLDPESMLRIIERREQERANPKPPPPPSPAPKPPEQPGPPAKDRICKVYLCMRPMQGSILPGILNPPLFRHWYVTVDCPGEKPRFYSFDADGLWHEDFTDDSDYWNENKDSCLSLVSSCIEIPWSDFEKIYDARKRADEKCGYGLWGYNCHHAAEALWIDVAVGGKKGR